MGITDVFKTKQMKSEIEQLTAENQYLKSIATPEMVTAANINTELHRLSDLKQRTENEITN